MDQFLFVAYFPHTLVVQRTCAIQLVSETMFGAEKSRKNALVPSKARLGKLQIMELEE